MFTFPKKIVVSVLLINSFTTNDKPILLVDPLRGVNITSSIQQQKSEDTELQRKKVQSEINKIDNEAKSLWWSPITPMTTGAGVLLALYKILDESKLNREQRKEEKNKNLYERFDDIAQNFSSQTPKIEASAIASLTHLLDPIYEHKFDNSIYLLIRNSLLITEEKENNLPVTKLRMLRIKCLQEVLCQLFLSDKKDNIDLSGCYLEKIKINQGEKSNITVNKINLYRTELPGSTLENIVFQNSELNETKFNKTKFNKSAELTNITFQCSTIVSASFNCAIIQNTNFIENKKMSECDFNGAKLQTVKFQGKETSSSEINGTKWRGCKLSDHSSFSYLNISNNDFKDTEFENVTFLKVTIINTNFVKSPKEQPKKKPKIGNNQSNEEQKPEQKPKFTNVIYEGGEFNNVIFDEVEFNNVTFIDTKFVNVTFKNIIFNNVNFMMAMLDDQTLKSIANNKKENWTTASFNREDKDKLDKFSQQP